MITAEHVREFLRYEPDTGKLFWLPRDEKWFPTPQAAKAWNSRWSGASAFTALNDSGYLHGNILAKKYRAHRVIWCHVTGEWPELFIDHIDGVRSDNIFSNLRLVTYSENCKNAGIRNDNKSSATGVSWNKRCGRWVAYASSGGIRHDLGMFSSLDEAKAARKSASERLAFHKNHGARSSHA